MADLLDKVRKHLQKDRPKGSDDPYQSGKKVKTRTEKMCEAGDENACAKLREQQSTDSNQ